MKRFLLFICMGIQFLTVSGQPKPGNYFRLNVQYFEEEGGEKYLGVSPELKKSLPGKLGEAIQKYPRRFRYILLNKNRFQNTYEALYPDTVKINQLYSEALASDSLFMSYFSSLADPFITADLKKATYNTDELMVVAARFFYCSGVRADSTIISSICISLNGLTDVSFLKDYTLLEAFCFEAIFENLKTVGGKPGQFVENFKAYIKAGEKKEKPAISHLDDYLARVRQYCFERMENDISLRQVLLSYYARHRESLPFSIVPGKEKQ